MNKIPKEAICIRNTSSWGNLKPEHKFDSPRFNIKTVIKDLPLYSPKFDILLKKIHELDESDLKEHGKLYKHIIYSDVSGPYGAKMLASVLIANGLSLVYNNGLKIKKKEELEENKSFGLLTTSTVYKKPLTVRLKKTLLANLNERPANIQGVNMRFLIIDPGFKEGIDVFDVKYMHMLEPLVTKAEQTQVIGRGTRYCGQMGLPFIPNKGWILNVFRYNMKYDNDTNMHELYLKYSNQNISAINFIADLEELVKASSVDSILTENIHNYENKNNRFFKMIKDLNKPVKSNSSEKKKAKDYIKIVNNIRGKIFTNEVKLDCKLKCSGPLETAPKAIIMIAALHVGTKELIKPLNEKFAKPFLCNYIDKNPEYCKAINSIWLSPIRFLKIYKKNILSKLEDFRRAFIIHQDNYKEIKEFIQQYTDDIQDDKKARIIFKPIPPPNKMGFIDLQKYIEKHYSNYKLDNIEIKNKCIEDSTSSKSKKEYDIVKFTKTQQFVQDYFVPSSPYKGMFLYHSVGSGKTCTAIATATNSFDKQGYTILWVTRHTLKEDIWKNMFDKICNVIIQEKIKKGEKLPVSRADRMRMLGNNWIQPISYKQFTNMIAGKNKLYGQMVSLNGKDDPFKNTLVIIDEIHKIFSNTLSTLEKPNPEVLQKMIQNSFEKSGNNSLRLLVMTATPLTEDPMSVIKIINLLMPSIEQFTEDFEKFKEEYCQENGLFTENGSFKFMNKVAGLISHIDRSSDISQFSYPIIKDIMIETQALKKSFKNTEDIEKQIEYLKDKLKTDLKTLSKDKINGMKEEIKELKNEIKDILKEKNAPENIIGYINNCITAKKKKEPKSPKNLKECPPNKVRNPLTGRCVKINV